MDGLYGGLEMEIEGLECGCVGHVDHRKTAVEMAFLEGVVFVVV